MFELVRLILDAAGQLLPFRIVWQHQRGLFFLAGRYQWTTGPGLKLIVPYFCDVKCISVVPDVSTTPMQCVTLRDGKHLTFSASITFRVTDPNLAYNTLGHWTETVVELASGIVSEGLADADPDRFDPARGKRDRLIEELRDDVDKAVTMYGLTVMALRLNNFALGVRTVRLLVDKAVLGEGNHFTAN